MVSVHITDPLKLISHAQKDKLKKLIKSNGNLSDDDLLNSIHYSGDKRYNRLDKKVSNDDTFIEFSIVEETVREDLRLKLKSKLYEKKHENDPEWIMYKRLKQSGSRFVGEDLPSPFDVKVKSEFYYKEMEVIKRLIPNFEKNPLYTYITMCLGKD